MVIKRIVCVTCLTAGLILAQGGPGPSSSTSTTSTKQVSLHIPNEMAPPGGLVQMKFMVTEPTPISTGKPIVNFDAGTFDAVLGIELFAPTGDVNGIAMINGSQVALTYTTTAGPQGTDYPIMSMALHVRDDAAVGSQTQFNLDPSSTWILGLLGATTMKPQPPAIVTVGGSVSITNIVPGGGLLPAGSVVSIQGIGFQPDTQVQLNAIKFSSIQFVSPREIQFTLAEDTNMTGQKIQVVNPDGSQDVYFSYLRGINLLQSARPMLAGAVPVFSSVTHSGAVFAPLMPRQATQFSGLAVQNPNQAPVDVTISLHAPTGEVLGSSTVTLPSGYRVMQEISEMTQGAAPVLGSYAVVSSTQPIQVFGFYADESTGSVWPFIAVQSQ